MPRLPHPGGDQGQWGQILNDYLSQAHNADGTLKSDAIQNDSITELKLDQDVRSKLNLGGGAQGATGAVGPQGPVGNQGATGPQGAQGIAGSPGAAGPSGPAGTPGVAGPTGPLGPGGATGPQGPTGTNGTDGQTGATGPRGATGPQGPAGSDGADSTVPGPQGATGPKGDDGTSVTITGSVANAAALPTGLSGADAGKGYITNDNGHLHVWSGTGFTDVGTVRGPQGPTGPQGGQGSAGTTGATGPQGPAGTNGQQGATGPMGASGPAGATTIGGISGLQAALDGKVTTSVTMSTIPSGSQFSRNITYTLATDNPDIAQIAINGIVKYWHNEWGAIRGTSPYNWGDALVRAVRSNGDGITSGRAFEVNDRRTGAPTPILWGVNWTDGRMVQGGQQVGAVFVLNANQSASDIPATLPTGTLIVRKRVS